MTKVEIEYNEKPGCQGIKKDLDAADFEQDVSFVFWNRYTKFTVWLFRPFLSMASLWCFVNV